MAETKEIVLLRSCNVEEFHTNLDGFKFPKPSISHCIDSYEWGSIYKSDKQVLNTPNDTKFVRIIQYASS